MSAAKPSFSAKKDSGRKSERAEAAPNLRCRTIVSSVATRVLETGIYFFKQKTAYEIHALREEKVREDIARRLKKVCANLSDDDFERLVKLMAARQVRCERRQSW